MSPERLEFGQSGQIGTRIIPMDKKDLEELSFDPTKLNTEMQDKEEVEEQEPLPHEPISKLSRK